MPGLSLSDIVNVQVNMAPVAIPLRNFGALCIAGPSDVIDTTERIREYSTLDEVVSDFGSAAPEYLAADLFFSQNPQPSLLYIGRWAQTATHARLRGEIFTSTQQASLLSQLQQVNTGTMTITIDGTVQNVAAQSASLTSGTFSSTDQATLLSTLQATTNGGFIISVDSVVHTVGPLNFAGGPTSAVLNSASMTPVQQSTALTALQGMNNGAFSITIDGTSRTTGPINFTAVASLTAAAALINTALTSWATVTYASGQMSIISKSTGTTSTIGYASAPGTGTDISATLFLTAATGASTTQGAATSAPISSLNQAAAMIAASLGTVANCQWTGTAFQIQSASQGTTSALTFASTPGSGTDISATLRLTAATNAVLHQGVASLNFTGISNLNGAATILTSALRGATCTWDGQRFNIENISTGPSSSISYASRSGSGQDISSIMGLQINQALPPVAGIAPETALACATALRNDPSWYGLSFAATLADADVIAVAGFIEGAAPTSIFGYTTQNTNVLNTGVTTDIASVLQSMVFMRTFGQFSSSSPYAACSMFGRAFTTDFEANNTMITLKFKQEPGVSYEVLTQSEAAALKSKNCNVFVYYQVGAAIIQEGVMANGYFFDEVQGLDWLANRIQTDLFNVLYTSPTKIPQTDAGVHILTTTVANSCQQGVVNGLVAPGQWNGPPMGKVVTGQQLPAGYYVYAPLVATQPQAIREQRIAPTIQALVKLAGAVHFANCIVDVNR